MIDYSVKYVINLPDRYGNIVFHRLPNGYVMLDSVSYPIIGIMDAQGNIVYEFNESSDIPGKYTYCKGIYKENEGLYYNRNTCKMYSVKNMRFDELYSFHIKSEQLQKISDGIKGKSLVMKESPIIDLRKFLKEDLLCNQ